MDVLDVSTTAHVSSGTRTGKGDDEGVRDGVGVRVAAEGELVAVDVDERDGDAASAATAAAAATNNARGALISASGVLINRSEYRRNWQ